MPDSNTPPTSAPPTVPTSVNGAQPAATPLAIDPRLWTLEKAVDALPLTGRGDLTRAQMRALVERQDARAAIGRCVDEMSFQRGLVEVLRCATEAEAPSAALRDGIDALADHISDQLERIQRILQGAQALMPR